MKCRGQRDEAAKERQVELKKRIGLRLHRRTEWASVKCSAPAEESFTVK